MNADQDILSVSLNEKGQIAVLSKGPQGYAVQIKIYDKNGKLLYTRNRNHTATDVALARDGSQVAVLSIDAVGGNLNTSIDVFSLTTSATEALCSYQVKDKLLYRMEYLEGGWLAAFSDSGVSMLDTADGLATVYAPAGMRVLGYAVSGEHLALALRPYGDTGDGQIHIINKQGEPTCTVDFTGDFRQLAAGADQYAVLTDTHVAQILPTGAGLTVAVPTDGQQVMINSTHAVVLGLNRIDAYPLTTE
jgi:hypothetical protein